MVAARSGMTANLTAENTVFIAGGSSTPSGSGLSTTELYSVATDSFVTTGLVSLSTGRAFPTATLLNTGELLIAGGLGNGATTNTTDLYTP